MRRLSLLVVVVCFALIGRDRTWVQDKEAEYQLVPFNSIRGDVPLRMVYGRAVQNGSFETFTSPLIQTKILAISADEMEWNHATGEIMLTGNVRLSMPTEMFKHHAPQR